MHYEKMMADLLRESDQLFPETSMAQLCSVPPPPEDEIKLAADQLAALAELQVEVTVELGRLEVSVDELIDLAPGKTFHYELPAGHTVTLKLSGAEIGRARLVERAGKTGIEILSLVQSAAISAKLS